MPKIIGASLVEHRQQIRRRLFGALATLMAEHGFDAVSLSGIAAAAGVGRTAVYNHFPDKETLLLAFIEDETATFVAALEDALAGIDDPEDQLRIYVRQQVRLGRSYRMGPGPELRTVVSRATAGRLGDHVARVEGVLRRILDAGIQAGTFPPQDVTVVVPLVNACLRGRSTRSADPAAVAAATEDFVLRAVGARSLAVV